MDETTPVTGPGSQAAATDGIVVTNLRRTFGDFVALSDVTAHFPAGKISALVGPNGAGKTTLMLIMASLLRPTSGSVIVGGFDPVTQTRQVRASIGWAPDVFGVYDNLTLSEYIEFFARSYAIPRQQVQSRIDKMLAMARLEEFANKPVHVLSRGQKQRLGLTRVLVQDPKILLLDEPASGLDPRSRVELKQLLRRRADSGATVVVSSHILSELEEVADQVVLIDHGKNVDTTQVSTARTWWKFAALDNTALATALSDMSLEHRTVGQNVEVPLTDEAAVAGVVKDLVYRDVQLVSVSPTYTSLENRYMELTGDAR